MEIYSVSAVCSTDFDIIDILKKFIKGFDLLLFCRKQHIGYRQIIYEDILSVRTVGRLFCRFQFDRYLEHVFRGAHHIGLQAYFVQIVIDYRQSILQGVVESAFRRRLLKGLICCYSVEHSILVYRRVLPRELSIISSLFYGVQLNQHSEDVFKGFGAHFVDFLTFQNSGYIIGILTFVYKRFYVNNQF